MSDEFVIAGRRFQSRLILGTGKYETFELMARALEVSGTEMVTVAVRRVNLSDKSKESLLDHIDPKRYYLLPNTAGCYSADDAIRTAMLAREVLDTNWVKLEVTPRPTLNPGGALPVVLLVPVLLGFAAAAQLRLRRRH